MIRLVGIFCVLFVSSSVFATDAVSRSDNNLEVNTKTEVASSKTEVESNSNTESSEDLKMENNKSLSEKEQLQGYQGFTKWLIDNKSSLDQVISETSRDSNTKWFVEPSKSDNKSKEKSEDNKDNNQSTNDTQTIYVVQKGDTLYLISKKYNLTVDQLLQINSLPADTVLKIGQQLKVPQEQQKNDSDINSKSQDTDKDNTSSSSPETSNLDTNENSSQEITSVENKEDQDQYEENEENNLQLPEYKFYKIRKGDTIYSIASRHKMTPQEVVELNPTLSLSEPLILDNIIKIKSNYNYLRVPSLNGTVSSEIVKDGFLWPVVGRLLISFGPQKGGIVNEGINIAAKQGYPVKATQDGVVTYVGNALSKFGNIILIQHDHQWVSAYAHVSDMKVKKGDTIKKGDIIANVSNTGGVSSPQLHFELRKNIKPMDPLVYLNSYR